MNDLHHISPGKKTYFDRRNQTQLTLLSFAKKVPTQIHLVLVGYSSLGRFAPFFVRTRRTTSETSVTPSAANAAQALEAIIVRFALEEENSPSDAWKKCRAIARAPLTSASPRSRKISWT